MRNVPEKFYAGDTLKFDVPAPSDGRETYRATDGWTLSFRLVGIAGTYSFDATADGDGFSVNVDASTTASWAPGFYSWTAYVTKSGERHIVGSGHMEILPNPVSASASDARSHVKRLLDAIEAVLEGRVTKDVESYTIGGRQLTRIPIPELLRLRDKYKAEYRRELQAERLAKGLRSGRTVRVRNLGQRY